MVRIQARREPDVLRDVVGREVGKVVGIHARHKIAQDIFRYIGAQQLERIGAFFDRHERKSS